MDNSNAVQIPKIIMQTWKTKEVPDHWKSSPKSIKRKMSDWQYVLMTDEDNLKFVGTYFPSFLPIYKEMEYPIMKADAIRYMWLYIKGGIYMDLDIMIKKDLSPLFTEKMVGKGDVFLIKSGNFNSFYTNSFMASKPKNLFWLECLAEMSKPYKFWMVGKHFKVMGKTGPLMVSRTVKYTKTNIVNLPKDLIMACSICDEKPCQVKDGYAINLEGSSWCSWDTHMYNYAMCKWRNILILIVIIIIIMLVIIIWKRTKTGGKLSPF